MNVLEKVLYFCLYINDSAVDERSLIEQERNIFIKILFTFCVNYGHHQREPLNAELADYFQNIFLPGEGFVTSSDLKISLGFAEVFKSC